MVNDLEDVAVVDEVVERIQEQTRQDVLYALLETPPGELFNKLFSGN